MFEWAYLFKPSKINENDCRYEWELIIIKFTLELYMWYTYFLFRRELHHSTYQNSSERIWCCLLWFYLVQLYKQDSRNRKRRKRVHFQYKCEHFQPDCWESVYWNQSSNIQWSHLLPLIYRSIALRDDSYYINRWWLDQPF